MRTHCRGSSELVKSTIERARCLGASKLAVSVRIRAAVLRKCTADPMVALITWQVISWEKQYILTLIDTRYDFYAMDAMSGTERFLLAKFFESFWIAASIVTQTRIVMYVGWGAKRGRRNINTSANVHHKTFLCNNGCSNSKTFKELWHESKVQASCGSTSARSDYKSIVLRVRHQISSAILSNA